MGASLESNRSLLSDVEHVISLGEMGGLQVLFLQLLNALSDSGTPARSVTDRSTNGPHPEFSRFADTIRSPNRSRALDVARRLTSAAGGTWVGSSLSLAAQRTYRNVRSADTSAMLHWNSLDASASFGAQRFQILYDHGYSTLKRPNTIELRRLRRMSGVICVSQSAKAALIETFDVDLPIYVVPNPIRELPLPDPTLRRPRDRDTDPITFGTASRLVPAKGVSIAIHAVAAVRRDGVDARLEIAGDGPERHRLERLARRLGVDHVTRFHGHIQNVSEFFGRVDVLLALSLREPFGLTPLEALSCGTPVIASDLGGHSENLRGVAFVSLIAPRQLASGNNGRSGPPRSPTRSLTLDLDAVTHALSCAAATSVGPHCSLPARTLRDIRERHSLPTYLRALTHALHRLVNPNP